MTKLTILYFVLLTSLLSTVCSADVGVIIYESIGVGKRQSDAGHIGLVSTRLCADGIKKVRLCSGDESPGIVINRYSRLVVGQKLDWVVMPLNVHLFGTREYADAPLIVSGGITKAVHKNYWRENLQPEIPALTEGQLLEIQDEEGKFSFVKLAIDILQLKPVMMLAGSFQTKPADETDFVIKDDDGTLIPQGRWREMLGVRQRRDSAVFLIKTQLEDEVRLMNDLNGDKNYSKFKAIGSNCSDFIEDKLKVVFKDPQISFPSKLANPADLFGGITTPLAVAKGLVGHAKRYGLGYDVLFTPEFSGTREISTNAKTIARGSLVPDISEGKIAFSIKAMVNYLNFLLGVSAEVANAISRPININKEVHEHNGKLADLQNQGAALKKQRGEGILDPEELEQEIAQNEKQISEEQYRSFGTTDCWKLKKSAFMNIVKIAHDKGILSEEEIRLLGKDGHGRQFPQALEKQGMAASYDAQGLVLKLNGATSGLTRRNIRDYVNSDSRSLAFKIVTATINYDLVGRGEDRRTTDEFDPDWQLFLNVANDNGINLAQIENTEKGLTLGVAQCSEAHSPHASDIKKGDLSNYGIFKAGWKVLKATGKAFTN